MQAVKKRAFKTPSSNFKALGSTDSLTLAQPMATESEAAIASFIHKPAAKRRRLLVCPALGSKEERTLGLKIPTPPPLPSKKNSAAESKWCPKPLEEISWSPEELTAPAPHEGEMQQQPPRSISTSAQPLVTLDTVHRLQANLVPQLIPFLPALSQSPNLFNTLEGSPVSDKGVAAEAKETLVPPVHIGKPRGASSNRRLRQSKMEDFAVSKKTCKGAGQIFAQSLAPSPSAAVRKAEMVVEEPKLGSQLSAAIVEQFTLQEDKWREIWNSPAKQLEEMMKAPALPFVRNLDMDFLRAIF